MVISYFLNRTKKKWTVVLCNLLDYLMVMCHYHFANPFDCWKSCSLPPVLHFHHNQELPTAQLCQKGVTNAINAQYSVSGKFCRVRSNSCQRQAWLTSILYLRQIRKTAAQFQFIPGTALVSGNAHSRCLASLSCRTRSGRGCLPAVCKIMTVFWGFSHMVIVEWLCGTWRHPSPAISWKLPSSWYSLDVRINHLGTHHSF